MIKVNKLNKYFNKNKQNEIHVINNVTLDFPQTGLVVLLGASGSGKTTLLNVIGGLDKVNSGSIEIDNNVITKYDANIWDDIRTKNIGYIFQNYNLLKDVSVYDNVAFVLKMIGINDKEEIEKRVNYILQAVNMFNFRKRKASQLSGGQQQRVAIARALVKNPKIIIADEPTGNLDSENTIEIMNILKVISKEKLVVLVTHEKDLAYFYSDRIIEIKDGQVISDQLITESKEHSFRSDNVIYLKDLTEILSGHENNFGISVHADNPEDFEKLNVRLVLKNKTWYLDIDSNIKNVKLVSDNVGIKIKDEHFKAKTKEELTATQFDLENLNNDNVRKNKKSTISLKNSLSLVIKKIITSTKKSKLILFAMGLSGLLMAFATSIFFSAFNLSYYDYLSLQSNYITIQNKYEEIDNVLPSYDVLREKVGQDFHIIFNNEIRYLQFYTEIGGDSYQKIYNSLQGNTFYIKSKFDFAETLNESKLIYGKLPSNDSEFVIDKITAENFIETAKYYGIWDFENLLNLKSRVLLSDDNFDYVELSLVGIVDNKFDAVYFTKPTYHLLTNKGYGYGNTVTINIGDITTQLYLKTHVKLPLEWFKEDNAFGEINLVAGRLPKDNSNEILLSVDSMYSTNIELLEQILPFELSIKNRYEREVGFNIVGFYKHNFFNGPVTTAFNLDRFKYEMSLIEDNYSNDILAIYVQNPQEAVNELNKNNFKTIWEYEKAKEIKRINDITRLTALAGGVTVLIVLNALGFYFIMRSSLMNRVYEISVYRALGVKKANIKKMFMFELLFLISLTSLIGYFIGTFFAKQIQTLYTSFGIINSLFYVNTLSVTVGLGVLYLINLFFGMLPITMLLRKTPSEILSKYDI